MAIKGSLDPLKHLTQLVTVDLAGCENLRGTLASLAKCSLLESVNVSATRSNGLLIEGTLLEIAGCKRLKEVDVTGCPNIADIEDFRDRIPKCQIRSDFSRAREVWNPSPRSRR